MSKHPFEGAFTALVTPFRADEGRAIDWPALDALLEWQLAAGIDGIVPCGTTGESPTLSASERSALIRLIVERAKGKARVVAGTGTNATESTIEHSKEAEQAGVDAVMAVVPYYNKPTQEGLVRHFVAVAAAVKCDVVVYNIPGRSGVDLMPETLSAICDRAKNVVAVKEATGNVVRAQEIVRRLGDRVAVLSGDDALTLPMMAVGARGVISVTSNLLPEHVGRLTRLAQAGRFIEARDLHLALLPVHEAMFVESNPSPVKAALTMHGTLKGRITDAVRSPLAEASPSARDRIRRVLEDYGRAP